MVCRFLTVGALSVALAGLVACSGDSKVAQCNSTSECPSGEVCQNKVCSKTCDSSTVCPGGYSCQNGLCVTGSTGVPEITTVSGLSTETCDDDKPCIGTGFVVTGKHLTNTTFTLAGPGTTTAAPFEMTRSDNNSDTVAELTPVLPRRVGDLQEGAYILTAVNQSGDTSSSVQLLRGEPGPDLTADQIIDRINTASDGKLIQARFLDVDGGGGGGTATVALSTYTDSETGFETVLSERQMRVVLTASGTGGPAKSLKINKAKLEQICGDANGCELNLGATRFIDKGNTSRVIESPMSGGGCRFYLDTATHGWTLSQDCVALYALMKPNPAGSSPPYVLGDPYQRYEYSNTYGDDGSGSTGTYTCLGTHSGDVDGQPLVVMSYKGACYLAEAPADNSQSQKGCFTADNDEQFYLVTSSRAWDYVDANGITAYPMGIPEGQTIPIELWPESDTARQCVLTVKD